MKTEILAGITTFMTLSYIIFVQPAVLSACGMDFGAVLVATCIASALATFLMGLYANYPVALAPGMGQNFFFAGTVKYIGSCFFLPRCLSSATPSSLADETRKKQFSVFLITERKTDDFLTYSQS